MQTVMAWDRKKTRRESIIGNNAMQILPVGVSVTSCIIHTVVLYVMQRMSYRYAQP